MNEKLILTADLGGIHVYRQEKSVTDHEVHLRRVDSISNEVLADKPEDALEEAPGRFPRGSGVHTVSGNLSSGERLGHEEEVQRRLIRQMASHINTILSRDSVISCSMAISPPIHKLLLDSLDKRWKEKVGVVLSANLMKSEPKELLARFQRE